MRKNTLFDKAVYIIFALVFLFIFIFVAADCNNLFVCFSFLIIGVISYLTFVFDKRFISINKMISAFLFIFCFFAPLFQYRDNTSYWGLGKFNDFDYFYANFLIIIFETLYFFTYKLFLNKKTVVKNNIHFSISNASVYILLILSILMMFILLKTGNLFSDDGGYSNSSASSFEVFALKLIRFFPVASFMVVVYFVKNNKINFSRKLGLFYSFIFMVMTLVVFNPASGSVARYLTLGTYLCVISILFDKSKNNSFLMIGIFIGFAIIFPSLNFFKYHSFNEISNFKFESIDLTENDYDAYYMFLTTIKYTENTGICFGGNIISAIFSIVPRSIWTGKFEPSGAIISFESGATFTNVSCPLFAEFYFAFGLVGLIVLTILFAMLIKKIDLIKNKHAILYGVNTVCIGLIFPLMRGSMLPMMSFILSVLTSYCLCYIIVHITCSNGVIYKTSTLTKYNN